MIFATRARIERTQMYQRRMYLSACGNFRVSEFFRRVEGRYVYYAERRVANGWDTIGQAHRTRAAAERACERFARGEGKVKA